VVTRQRPRSTRLLVVALVSISLAVITLDYRQGEEGPLAGLGRAALSAMAPLQKTVTTATEPIANFFIGLAHLPSLADDNRRLQDEVADLTTQVQRQAYLEAQADQLQGLLDLQRSLAPPSVAAVVIGNGLSNFRWTITIDKGSEVGIEVDMPVITGSPDAPRLVGRVVRASSGAADVQLIIDRNSAVAGRLSVSGESGLVEGQGEGDLRMALVDPGTEVEGNETVVTKGYEVSGERGLYPPGIIIGQVSRTLSDPNGLQRFVSVRPAVDFSALDFVLVLRTEGAA
jgi:rod shape-determining protein MreC